MKNYNIQENDKETYNLELNDEGFFDDPEKAFEQIMNLFQQNTSKMMQRIKDVLDENDINYKQTFSNGKMFINVSMKIEKYDFNISMFEDGDMFMTGVALPFNITSEKMETILKAINEINIKFCMMKFILLEETVVVVFNISTDVADVEKAVLYCISGYQSVIKYGMEQLELLLM